MVNLNIILLRCGDIERNPGPYSTFIQTELADLATALSTATDGNIYFSKSGGTIGASAVENNSVVSNMGFAYQFPDGTTTYYASGSIATPQYIPWTYPYTTLTATHANLWSNKLSLWLDAKETKSINATTEKIVSKDYTYSYPIVENSSGLNFVHASDTIDMTNGSMLESNATIPVRQYWKLAMAVTIPTQSVSNKTIFQHDDIIVKISSQTMPDTTTQYNIGLFDDATFIRGVTFKASDTTFKYYIFADSSSIMTVSGNTAFGSTTGSFDYGTNNKIYINQSSSAGVGNALIKLHEVLYYTSTANDISATDANMYSYLSNRWTLSTYADEHNIPPYTWTGTYSKGDRNSIITITSGMTMTNGPATTILNGSFSGSGPGVGDRCSIYPAGSGPWYIRFQLSVAQRIAGIKWGNDRDVASSLSSDWQGSNDGSTWTTLSASSFNLWDDTKQTTVLSGAVIPDTGGQTMGAGDGQIYTHLFNTPSTAYLYYRILFNVNPESNGISGGYVTEINFYVAS